MSKQRDRNRNKIKADLVDGEAEFDELVDATGEDGGLGQREAGGQQRRLEQQPHLHHTQHDNETRHRDTNNKTRKQKTEKKNVKQKRTKSLTVLSLASASNFLRSSTMMGCLGFSSSVFLLIM